MRNLYKCVRIGSIYISNHGLSLVGSVAFLPSSRASSSMENLKLKYEDCPAGGIDLEYIRMAVDTAAQNTGHFKDHPRQNTTIFLAKDGLEDKAVNAGKEVPCYVSSLVIDASWFLDWPEDKSTFVFLVAKKGQKDALRPLTHGSGITRRVQSVSRQQADFRGLNSPHAAFVL